MNKKYLSWNSQNDIKIAAQELLSGNILLGDSDTVLGLFAQVSERGFKTLNELKGRLDKPYIVLVQNEQEACRLMAEDFLSERKIKLLDACWPGPLTVIVPSCSALPSFVKAGDGSIAIRVPNHSGLEQLLALTGPLFSTSANKAGFPVPDVVEDVDQAITEKIVWYVAGDKTGTVSTILDLKEENIKVVRRGSYDVATLEEKYGKLFIK